MRRVLPTQGGSRVSKRDRACPASPGLPEAPQAPPHIQTGTPLLPRTSSSISHSPGVPVRTLSAVPDGSLTLLTLCPAHTSAPLDVLCGHVSMR